MDAMLCDAMSRGYLNTQTAPSWFSFKAFPSTRFISSRMQQSIAVLFPGSLGSILNKRHGDWMKLLSAIFSRYERWVAGSIPNKVVGMRFRTPRAFVDDGFVECSCFRELGGLMRRI